jgi:CHAT domain-containing protein
LLVVADGPLDFIPFAALLDPRTKSPLIDSYEIVRLPSATALAVLRESAASRQPRPHSNIAVLSDPVFDSHDERLTGAVGRTTEALPAALTSTLRETGLTLPRLAFSYSEAAAIEKAAPRGTRVDVMRGTDANRNFVTSSSLGTYRIIHFATHGLLNPDSPALSGIVLSLVDKQGRPQDGFLRLHDIYNLHLNADLVVLSACQTALGQQINGEGVIGLSRGFFYAGAERVLASLWAVEDSATANFMGSFYVDFLSKQMTPAAALRAAQLELRRKPQWSSPYFWAAFELQGEWR